MTQRSRLTQTAKVIFFGAITAGVVIFVDPLALVGKLQWFPVKSVSFHSGYHVTLADVERLCGRLRGSDTFALKLGKVRKCIESLGWVEDVTISRRLPSALIVQITETTPIAIIWNDGGWKFASQTKIIGAVGDKEIMRYPMIPQFDALNEEQKTESLKIATLVAQWSIKKGIVVSDVTWEPRKGWVTHLGRGTAVILGEHLQEENVERFQVLLQHFENIIVGSPVIDLRIEKKIVVKGRKQS